MAETTDYPIPPAAPTPRRGRGCLPGVLGGCLLSFLLMVGTGFAFVTLLATLGYQSVSKLPTGEAMDYYESLRGEGEVGVLRLELNGLITGAAPNRWYLPPDCDAAVRTEIEDAIACEAIDAILLVVDSPGGGVTASDAIYHALERFKASAEGRKVFVLGGDVMASGAYYLAMQADWIRLHPTTLIGSIGVILPGVNAAGLAQKLGLVDNSIASGASKDLGNPLKPINPAHNAILKQVVDALYNRFVALVAKGRRLTEEDVRKLADGRIFSANDAVNLRLADDIGYEDTFDAKMAEVLGCEEAALTIYTPSYHEDALRAFLSDFPYAFGRAFTAPLTTSPKQAPEYRW